MSTKESILGTPQKKEPPPLENPEEGPQRRRPFLDFGADARPKNEACNNLKLIVYYIKLVAGCYAPGTSNRSSQSFSDIISMSGTGSIAGVH